MDKNLQDIQNKIRLIGETINDINNITQYYINKQSVLDKIISDIEHEIELDILSASELSVKMKELRTALRLRRGVKDNVAILNSVKADMNKFDTNKTINHINNFVTCGKNRQYAHRVEIETRNEILGLTK